MNAFEKNIISISGKRGELWLTNLNHLVTRLAKQWNLTELKTIENLSYNYVLKGKQNNLPIILKIGFNLKAIEKESSALKAYNGNGCIKILAQDLKLGALLLEQITTGLSLKTFFPSEDEKATIIAAKTIEQLHSCELPKTSNFPHTEQWLQTLKKNYSLPKEYLNKAISLSNHLLKTKGKDVLLHGDLHHDNILLDSAMKGKAIDPKGVVGEKEYEFGAFIRNPLPDIVEHIKNKEIISKRIEIFASHFNCSKARIKDWSFVQAMLAACWMIEDNLDPAQFIKLAYILLSL